VFDDVEIPVADLERSAAFYFASYLLDPDGHNVEAVHRLPETRSGWDWLGLGLVRDGR
jgi:catechol 2,3-dioxygenase-like lactoylglutathione lyase family enzyme